MTAPLRPLSSPRAADDLASRGFSSSGPRARGIDARNAPYAVLLLRVALGVMFVAHAHAKLVVFTLPRTAAFFVEHGFPAWTAYLVFVMELVGGVALVVGAYTRWVAIALVPVMLGAFAVHWPNGWLFNAPNGGWEYVAFLTVMLIAQSLAGDGAHAVRRSPWPAKTR